MNSWSTHRKRIIFSLVLAVLIFLIAVPVYLILHRVPTCFDGKRNGDEIGVDCGGSCQLLCPVESLPIIPNGDPRVLIIATSTYEVVALFENPNIDAEVYRAGYVIKLYESANPLPIKIMEGETYVPRNSVFAIFEGPFLLEDALPQRAIFSWKNESLVWQKSDAVLPRITIQNKELTRTDTTPRLELRVGNNSLNDILNLEFIVLLSDEFGNTFAGSKTYLDSLPAGGSMPAVFTWPRPFENEAVLIDIVPRILPDKSFIR